MSWNTKDMAEALPTAEPVSKALAGGDAPTPKKTPLEAGWVPKQVYDYDIYNKSSKELFDEGLAAGGLDAQDWASNAAKYEWDDEYGDVGPKFPELEKQLFGSEFHTRTGIEFEKIKEISVVQESVTKVQPVRSFEDAGLHEVMLENVKLAGYDVPTPVQAYCLPAIFKGHDVVACAQTGSGKTAAFLIPTLSKLMGKAKKLAAPRPNPATFREGVDRPVRAEPLLLVVCPSRELATQIFDEARRFCYRSMLRPCVLYGGGPAKEQMKQLQKGCDVLIGTPGRLCDFIDRPHVLSLHRLKYMIIDEADEMLSSDWETELKKIMTGGDQELGNVTYMMFSATFPKMARDLAKEHLAHDHIRIRVGRAGSSHVNIKQNIVFVEDSMKRKALVDLLYSNKPARTIIFVNSKRAADELDDYLFQLDLPCTSIHSDRTQREREDALRAFRTGKTPILVATGVSARGLDVRNVLHVIQYDLPSNQYGGIEEYIHRIGRTGRIGNLGLATSFYNERNEDIAPELTKILLETKQQVPDFLESYLPEGGKDAVLKFDADSDDEDEETGEAASVGNDGASGWAALTEAPVVAEASAGGGGWGPAASTGGDGWGPAASTGGDGWGPAASTGGDGWGPAASTGGSGWGGAVSSAAATVIGTVAAPIIAAASALGTAKPGNPDPPAVTSNWGAAPTGEVTATATGGNAWGTAASKPESTRPTAANTVSEWGPPVGASSVGWTSVW